MNQKLQRKKQEIGLAQDPRSTLGRPCAVLIILGRSRGDESEITRWRRGRRNGKLKAIP